MSNTIETSKIPEQAMMTLIEKVLEEKRTKDIVVAPKGTVMLYKVGAKQYAEAIVEATDLIIGASIPILAKRLKEFQEAME